MVAAHLDVELLEHDEQRDLDAIGEVRQRIDREDATVSARAEAVVYGFGITGRRGLRSLERAFGSPRVPHLVVRGWLGV